MDTKIRDKHPGYSIVAKFKEAFNKGTKCRAGAVVLLERSLSDKIPVGERGSPRRLQIS